MTGSWSDWEGCEDLLGEPHFWPTSTICFNSPHVFSEKLSFYKEIKSKLPELCCKFICSSNPIASSLAVLYKTVKMAPTLFLSV